MSQNFWKIGFTLHACFVVLVAVLAYLGILPTTYKVIPYADVIGHAVLIGLLAFFLDGTLKFRPLFPGKLSALRLAPLLILAVAGIEEVAQRFSPRRASSLIDFAADVVGVLLASCLAYRLEQRVRGMKNQRSPAINGRAQS